MSNIEILLGTDPEVFCVDAGPNELYDSSFLKDVPFANVPVAMEFQGIISPLNGDNKHPLYYSNADANLIGDGVAFEVNLKRPFKNPLDMRKSVLNCLSEAEHALGTKFSITPVVNFNYRKFCTEELMENDRFAMSVLFGCDPDEDAYDLDYGSPMIQAERHPYRYGGGHIHISNIGDAVEYPRELIKLLAITAGNFINANTEVPELTKIRGELYGNPGRFRRQEYSDGTKGIEYRSPSNEWLKFSDEKLETLFNLIKTGVGLFYSSGGQEVLNKFGIQTFRAMKTNDIILSSQILSAIESRFME